MTPVVSLPDPLYADPQAYDIAYGWDSYEETCAYLRAAESLADRSLRRTLEIGCGTGRVLRDLVRAGKEAVGLDRDPHLLRYARQRLGELGEAAEFIESDMRDFTLTKPVDLAVSPINGIGYLTGEGDLARHLAAVAANLTHGGVYVIELSFGPIETSFIGKAEPWAFERDNVRVLADWRLLEVDADTGLAVNEATLIVKRPAEAEKRLVVRHTMRKWDQPTFYGIIADSPLSLVEIRQRDMQALDPATRLTYADDNVFVFLQKF